MSTAELALVVAALSGLGVVINALLGVRRAPTDIKKGEAETRKLTEEADRIQIDTSMTLVTVLQAQANQLRQELDVLRTRQDGADKREYELDRELFDVKARLVVAETRAANAESRLAESDRRAQESRLDIIKIGNELDRERKESRSWINKLAIIVGKLLSQLRSSGAEPDLNSDDLEILDKLSCIG